MKRRKVLGSLGLIGGSAAIGGFATQAAFNDRESVGATMTAGELDIQIDWRSTHNGTVINGGGPTDVDGKLVGAFKDVKPCDTGCIELSLHNDTNPAYIWTAFEIVNDNDNNLNEPERKAEDGNFSTTPEDGSSTDGCFFGGKLEDWNGTQFGVIENGQQTDTDNEYILLVDADGKTQNVRVELYVEETKESELTKYSLETLTDGFGICKVDTKSGGGPADSDDKDVKDTTDFSGCVTGKTEVVESPSTVPNGQALQGISFIEVYVCNTDGSSGEPVSDDDGELDDCITGRFFEDPNENCVPQQDEELFFGAPYDEPVENSPDLRSAINGSLTRDAGGINLGKIGTPTTDDDPSKEWYSLQWKLPCDCGNEVQTDSFQLNVYFYAQQARHNDNPTSPWGDGDSQTCTPTCPEANIPSGVSGDFLSVEGVDESSFPTVEATTRVETTAGGNGNLTASNFLMDEESGGEVCGQTITDVRFGSAQDQTEADVMIVLDNSGSMDGRDPDDKLENAINGAFTLIGGDEDPNNDPDIGGLDSTVNAGFVRFGDGATLKQGLTTDHTLVENEIDSLSDTFEGTAMEQGIIKAQDELDANGDPNTPNFMVVLANGNENAGSDSRDAAQNARNVNDLNNSGDGTTIISIAYGSGADEELMEDISSPPKTDDDTIDENDANAFVGGTDDISTVFSDIGSIISGTYTIEYETTQCEPDGSDRTVTVYVDDPNEGEATGTGDYTAPSS